MAGNSNRSIDKYKVKKDVQKAIDALASGKDIVGIFPTGYGKSNIFGLLPDQKEKEGITNSFVLVISPLLSLMADQVTTWTDRGVPAVAITCTVTEEEIKGIYAHNYKLIFASPEAIMGDDGVNTQWEELLTERKHYMAALVFDEAHAITLWGKDFRVKYSEVGQLRGTLSGVPVAALSATLTEEDAAEVQTLIGIHNAEVFVKLPNRTKIFLDVREAKADLGSLDWLKSEFMEDPQKSPKTLLFARSINTLTKIFRHLVTDVPEEIETGIEMFHGHLDPQHRDNLKSNFAKENSTIRLMLATSAYGMGVSTLGLQRVIHWGPPKTVPEYWQEVGRCSREGNAGIAIMYMPSYARAKISEDMKAFLDGICYRRSVLEKLVFSGQDPSDLDQYCFSLDCCSRCVSLLSVVEMSEKKEE